MKNLLILLVLMLTFTGCAQVEQTQTPQEEVSTTESTTEILQEEVTKTESISDIMSQISEKYTTNNDFNMCFKENIDMCIQNVTSGEEEAMNCDDFILETNKNSCMQSQLSMKAIQEKDISMCATLESGKDSCEYEVAVNLGMLDYNTEICSSVSEDYKTSCINQIVMYESQETKDVKVCDKLLGEDEEMLNYDKEFCVEEIGYMILDDERIKAEELEQAKMQEEEDKRMEEEEAVQAKIQEEENKRIQAEQESE